MLFEVGWGVREFGHRDEVHKVLQVAGLVVERLELVEERPEAFAVAGQQVRGKVRVQLEHDAYDKVVQRVRVLDARD